MRDIQKIDFVRLQCARGMPGIDERPLRTIEQAKFERRVAMLNYADALARQPGNQQIR